jgi:hypothetical protein
MCVSLLCYFGVASRQRKGLRNADDGVDRPYIFRPPGGNMKHITTAISLSLFVQEFRR